MRKIMMIALMTMSVMMANAQGGLKRVYNESIDPMTQIDEALTKAKADGKFVVCQVPHCCHTVCPISGATDPP